MKDAMGRTVRRRYETRASVLDDWWAENMLELNRPTTETERRWLRSVSADTDSLRQSGDVVMPPIRLPQPGFPTVDDDGSHR